MASIFATNAEILRKAGDGINNDISGSTYTDDFANQAESFINCITRFNWSDNYSSLDADVQGILKEACTNLAAMYLIMYDMSGYTSRTEAELMIRTLKTRFDECVALLSDDKVRVFMSGA